MIIFTLSNNEGLLILVLYPSNFFRFTPTIDKEPKNATLCGSPTLLFFETDKAPHCTVCCND